MEIGIARCCVGKDIPIFSWSASQLERKGVQKFPHNVLCVEAKTSCSKLAHSRLRTAAMNSMNQTRWRMHVMSVNTENSLPMQPEDYPADGEEDSSTDSSEEQLLSSDDLRALLVDSERSRLNKKLSEANQQNRFLKRQLYAEEDALVNFKSELAVMELEIQFVDKPDPRFLFWWFPSIMLSPKEIAQSEIPESTRKINGKYIQSHLLSRLEAVHEKLKEQIKDVDAAESKEVTILWCGMAESVQVMGTFDGWSQGEHLSPEYDGSFSRFTTTLMLRPGRYEIKFLVDGEWQVSPEYPTFGEGLTKNNLLIVE